MTDSERMRYIGTLALLGHCSVYVPEEMRESIQEAMEDACQNSEHLGWHRTLNLIELDILP